MARPVRAVEDIGRIVHIHNKVRCVFSVPGPVASFVNENTVVRAAAVMEHYLERRFRRRVPVRKQKRRTEEDLLGPWDAGADWPDVCMRTVFVLRHFIVHLGGRYRPRSLRPLSRKILLPAYRRFSRCIPAAKVRENEALCLDATNVITPILLGCRDYWRGTRPRRARKLAAP